MRNETILKVLSILITVFITPLIIHFFFSFLEVLFLEEISGKVKIITAIMVTVFITIFSFPFMFSDEYLLKFLKK